MEYVNCILCNSKDSFRDFKTVKDRFDSNKYELLKCACGLIMLNPRPKLDEIAKHYNYSEYSPHYKKSNTLGFLYKIAQKINNFSKLITIRNFYKGSKKKILDYGGGDGQFCKYMNRKGWKTCIYEPLLENMIDGVEKVNLNHKNKFNVITMFHSLEHIHEIDDAFKSIERFLESTGILVISVPNHDAYERRFFGSKWVAYDAPRHLYHFTFESMKHLLDKNNFRIEKYKPMYLDTFHNAIMSHQLSFLSIPVIVFQILVSIINIFRDNKKASSLLFVCRKK